VQEEATMGMIEIRNLTLLILGAMLALTLANLGLETIRENWLGGVLIFVGFATIVGGAIYPWATQGEVNIREGLSHPSLWWLAPGLVAVFLVPPLEYLYLAEIIPRGLAMQLTGLAFILAGLALCIWMRSTLKRMGYRKAGRRLIQSGPYRFMRHPGYAAFILLVFGLCLGYSSLIGLVAALVLLGPGLAYRMKVEEQPLIERFGDEYRAYARRTKQIIPALW
jgi:protein-S-isoprenylcysteine O-methyltransferase Ste14